MKKIFLMLALVAFATTFTSCKDKEVTVKEELTTDSTVVNETEVDTTVKSADTMAVYTQSE